MNIGLSSETRKIVAENLQILLANEYVLLTKSYKYHWNVKGKHFGPLHALFQKGFEMLSEAVDEIAERIQQIGFPAKATLQEFLEVTSIKEKPGFNPEADEMIRELCNDHEMIIIQLRKLVDMTDSQHREMGTSDYLLGLMQTHEKYAWLLRSHLQ